MKRNTYTSQKTQGLTEHQSFSDSQHGDKSKPDISFNGSVGYNVFKGQVTSNYNGERKYSFGVGAPSPGIKGKVEVKISSSENV